MSQEGMGAREIYIRAKLQADEELMGGLTSEQFERCVEEEMKRPELVQVECPNCEGSGMQLGAFDLEVRCKACDGLGTVAEYEEIGGGG